MTVNRGLDGPLFLCPDAYAMKHTILNKILNALTFGMLNRIAELEYINTMNLIEDSVTTNKLNRVDTDVTSLEKRIIQQGDSLTDLREHVRAVLNSESQALKDMIINTWPEIVLHASDHAANSRAGRRLYWDILLQAVRLFQSFQQLLRT